jgi:hypothetical protein
MDILASNFVPLLAHTPNNTPNRRTLVTETHFGSSTNQIAHAVSLDTNHANAFVAARVETCWSRLDHSGGEMHHVFIVISEGSDGAHIARTVYAASEDDARQTHQENYPGEPIVAVHQ